MKKNTKLFGMGSAIVIAVLILLTAFTPVLSAEQRLVTTEGTTDIDKGGQLVINEGCSCCEGEGTDEFCSLIGGLMQEIIDAYEAGTPIGQSIFHPATSFNTDNYNQEQDTQSYSLITILQSKSDIGMMLGGSSSPSTHENQEPPQFLEEEIYNRALAIQEYCETGEGDDDVRYYAALATCLMGTLVFIPSGVFVIVIGAVAMGIITLTALAQIIHAVLGHIYSFLESMNIAQGIVDFILWCTEILSGM